jgi:spermidine/putrescine transport system ATP-binding protein
MTVAQNIAFPLRMSRCPPTEMHERLQEALEQVRLTGKAGKYPHELSGGEKQRVALARGLVSRPRLLLLDESLAALDAKLREEVQVELINLQRDVGITFVFVTHAQSEALALSHRIAVMNQGRVEQVDEPSRLYGFPKNRFVADFIGHINMIDAQVLEATHGHVRLAVAGLGEIIAPPADAVAGEHGVFSIRPEQVRIGVHGELAELKNHFAGIVHSVLYQGDVSVYKVKLTDGIMIEALLPNSAPGRAELFAAGDAVKVGWRHDAGMFLHG